MEVCVGWVRGQVQLLPVRQVIKAWWALSDVMKCSQEGRDVPVAPRRAFGQVPELGSPVGVESIEMGAWMAVCSIGVPQMIPL